MFVNSGLFNNISYIDYSDLNGFPHYDPIQPQIYIPFESGNVNTYSHRTVKHFNTGGFDITIGGSLSDVEYVIRTLIVNMPADTSFLIRSDLSLMNLYQPLIYQPTLYQPTMFLPTGELRTSEQYNDKGIHVLITGPTSHVTFAIMILRADTGADTGAISHGSSDDLHEFRHDSPSITNPNNLNPLLSQTFDGKHIILPIGDKKYSGSGVLLIAEDKQVPDKSYFVLFQSSPDGYFYDLGGKLDQPNKIVREGYLFENAVREAKEESQIFDIKNDSGTYRDIKNPNNDTMYRVFIYKIILESTHFDKLISYYTHNNSQKINDLGRKSNPAYNETRSIELFDTQTACRGIKSNNTSFLSKLNNQHNIGSRTYNVLKTICDIDIKAITGMPTQHNQLTSTPTYHQIIV